MEWINVKYELPPEGKAVLLYVELRHPFSDESYNKIVIGTYYNDYYSFEDSYKCLKVTHWAELIETPK